MNTTALSTTIFQLLDDPTLVPERRWVEAMLLQYPAFIAPAALLLERDPNLPADYRRQLTARVALLAGDRRALAMRIDQEAKALAAQFPPEPAAPDPSTENTIEGFLDRYSTADHDREAAVLERLIFNPVAPDYAATLDDDDDVATAPQSDQDADSSCRQAGAARERVVQRIPRQRLHPPPPVRQGLRHPPPPKPKRQPPLPLPPRPAPIPPQAHRLPRPIIRLKSAIPVILAPVPLAFDYFSLPLPRINIRALRRVITNILTIKHIQ